MNNLTRTFLYATIIFAPLYVIRFKIGGVPFIGSYPTTLLEVLIGLTVVSWLIGRIRNQNCQTAKLPNCWLPIFLFLLAGIISTIVSPDKRGALGVFKAYIVEPILIYLIILDVIKTKRDWEMLLKSLLISGGWIAALAVIQGLTGKLVFTPHEMAQGRAHAVYNTANAVGLYLGPLITLALGGIGAVGAGLMILAIVLSKSTGALVALGFTLLALAVGLCTNQVCKRWLRYTVCVVVAVCLIAGGWFFFNLPRFTPDVLDPQHRQITDTTTLRLCLWEGARNLLLDRPIFGAGLSGFKELYSTKYYTCDAEPLEYPHNIILNFWAEMGILGLISFGWVVWRAVGQSDNKKAVKLPNCFAAALIYWLIHGLVDVPYFKNDLALEFWVLMGLLETYSSDPSGV